MCLNLVTLQVHLGLENHKLLFQALFIQASEMILVKVILQRVVVNIILLLTMRGASVTDVATFMFITAMSVQLVVAVESLTTKSTFRVSPEATLVYSSRLVIARFFVLTQFRRGK